MIALCVIIIIIVIILIVFCVLSCKGVNLPFNMGSMGNMSPFNMNSFKNGKNKFTAMSPDRQIIKGYLNDGPSIIPDPILHQDINGVNKLEEIKGQPIDRDNYNKLMSKTNTAQRGTISDLRTNKSPGTQSVFNTIYGNMDSIPMEKIKSAEQELWMANYLSTGQISLDNLNLYGLVGAQAAPTMNYNSYLDGFVADPRLVNNHSKWVNEMLPWSGTATTVDDLDEAMEASTKFTGLRRPQATYQSKNALFVTENDASTYTKNKKGFGIHSSIDEKDLPPISKVKF